MKKTAKTAPLPTVRLRDVSQSLPVALMRARESVMQYFRPHLREHGVTEQQWRVLRVLYKAGEIEIAELASRTLLLGPSLSRILRDLEANDLVLRRSSEQDLRRFLVSIAPDGVRLLAAGAASSESAYREITRRFGEERLEKLFALLTELEESLTDEPPVE